MLEQPVVRRPDWLSYYTPNAVVFVSVAFKYSDRLSLSSSASLEMMHRLMSLMTKFESTFSDFVRELNSRAVFSVQAAYHHWHSVLFGGLYEYVGEGREKVMGIFTSTVMKVG